MGDTQITKDPILSKYKLWLFIYEKHLLNMYNLLDNKLNKYKVKVFHKIGYKEFFVFAFNHSSQYISPFV